MNVKLMKTTDDKRKTVKATSDIITLTGVSLKENTSVTNPILLIKVTTSDLIDCNYVYIGSFKRFYFVTDKVSVKNGLWELHLHCDVLSSFWSQLKESNAIVERSETNYNSLITDNTVPIKPQKQFKPIPFPSTARGFTGNSFILAVNG